jgi:hypothetical protein
VMVVVMIVRKDLREKKEKENTREQRILYMWKSKI